MRSVSPTTAPTVVFYIDARRCLVDRVAATLSSGDVRLPFGLQLTIVRLDRRRS